MLTAAGAAVQTGSGELEVVTVDGGKGVIFRLVLRFIRPVVMLHIGYATNRLRFLRKNYNATTLAT